MGVKGPGGGRVDPHHPPQHKEIVRRHQRHDTNRRHRNMEAIGVVGSTPPPTHTVLGVELLVEPFRLQSDSLDIPDPTPPPSGCCRSSGPTNETCRNQRFTAQKKWPYIHTDLRWLCHVHRGRGGSGPPILSRGSPPPCIKKTPCMQRARKLWWVSNKSSKIACVNLLTG